LFIGGLLCGAKFNMRIFQHLFDLFRLYLSLCEPFLERYSYLFVVWLGEGVFGGRFLVFFDDLATRIH